MSPEIRVSLPMIILALWFVSFVSTIAAALPICIASSQVSSVIATPLAPSVPNNLPIIISSFSRSYLYIIFYLCKLYINTHIKLIRYNFYQRQKSAVTATKNRQYGTRQKVRFHSGWNLLFNPTESERNSSLQAIPCILTHSPSFLIPLPHSSPSFLHNIPH